MWQRRRCTCRHLVFVVLLGSAHELGAQGWRDSAGVVTALGSHVRDSIPGVVGVRRPYVIRERGLEPVTDRGLLRLTDVLADGLGVPVVQAAPDTVCAGRHGMGEPGKRPPARILMLRDARVGADSAHVRAYVEVEPERCAATGREVAEWTFWLVRQRDAWVVESARMTTAW